jgi:hypothetical protein
VSDVYALVRSIRENRLPRNRHFEEHEQPVAQEARRLHRFLRAIESDLREATSVEVAPGGAGGVVVTMRFPAVRLSRVVALTREEIALLVEDPQLATVLQLAVG